MPIVYNDLPRIYEVKYNGTNLQKVTYNGALVFDRLLKITYSFVVYYRLVCDYEDAYQRCLQVSYPYVELQIDHVEISFYNPHLISEVILTGVYVNYAPTDVYVGNMQGKVYTGINEVAHYHWSDERKSWGYTLRLDEFWKRIENGGTIPYEKFQSIVKVTSQYEDIYPTGKMYEEGNTNYLPRLAVFVKITGKSILGDNITFDADMIYGSPVYPSVNITKSNWSSGPITGYKTDVISLSSGWEK